MSGKIKVDPAMLDQAAKTIDGYVGEYEKLYKEVFQKVEALKGDWDGADSLAFIEQVNGFKNDFDNMSKEMKNYSKFLKDSANAYRTAQEEIASSAKKLAN